MWKNVCCFVIIGLFCQMPLNSMEKEQVNGNGLTRQEYHEILRMWTEEPRIEHYDLTRLVEIENEDHTQQTARELTQEHDISAPATMDNSDVWSNLSGIRECSNRKCRNFDPLTGGPTPFLFRYRIPPHNLCEDCLKENKKGYTKLKADLGWEDVQLSSKTIVLFLASRGATAAIERRILAGTDIDARDLFGNTPLMLAARSGCLDTVECLLQHGADITARNAKNQDAIDLAEQPHHGKIANILRLFKLRSISFSHQDNIEAGTDFFSEDERAALRSAALSILARPFDVSQ